MHVCCGGRVDGGTEVVLLVEEEKEETWMIRMIR